MPASADLLKVLAENPKSLQQDFGCMTGIFQIFDRQQAFIGRRYGSKRVSNASGEILLLPTRLFSCFRSSSVNINVFFLPTPEEYSLVSMQLHNMLFHQP